MEKLGEKIKRRRKDLGLSQKELAATVGVSHVAISQWESDTNAPKTENFMNLATALKMTIVELLSDVDLQVMDDETFESIVLLTYPRLDKDRRRKLISRLWDIDAGLEK